MHHDVSKGLYMLMTLVHMDNATSLNPIGSAIALSKLEWAELAERRQDEDNAMMADRNASS